MYKERVNAKWLEQGYIEKFKELQDREALQILSHDHEPLVLITQNEYHALLAARRMVSEEKEEPVPAGSLEDFLAKGKSVRDEIAVVLAQADWSNS